MNFTVDMDYDYQDVYNWNRLYRGVIMKRFTSVTHLLLYVCALAFFACGIILLVGRSITPGFFVLLAIYILFVYYFCSANRLYTGWGMKYYSKHGYTGKTVIDETGIACDLSGRQKHFDFSDIGAVYQVSDCLYIQPKRGYVLILPAKRFVSGSIDNCTSLFEGNGLAVKHITL